MPDLASKRLSILQINHTWLRDELRALGHRVLAVGLGNNEYDHCIGAIGLSWEEISARLPGDFDPDCIIYYDNSGTPWFTGIERIQAPIAFYSVDTHHHHAWHAFFSTLFDCTLVAQKDYLPFFAGSPREVRWFPLWSTRDLDTSVERTIDVCFRGNLDPEFHPERLTFFTELSQLIPIDYARGDYGIDYPRSKIVVNQTVLGDLNFRVFEALTSGALLVTPATSNGLSDLFQDGVHLVTYERDNPKDAALKIAYYLDHPAEREAIAARGHGEALRHHSNRARAQQLVEILSALESRQNPMVHLSAARSYLTTAAMLRRFGGEVGLPFLLEAMNNLRASAIAHEGCDGDFVAAVVLCRFCLEEIGLLEQSDELLAVVRSHYPDDLILSLTFTERLLAQGDIAGAHELATQISQSPQEILDSASRLLHDVKERIKVELGRWEA